ncbi:Glycosyltransferase, catalytic subunit of cellulose synthase and poly-beta-1,6-N-acetylglucosamine synthase [Cyclobacterium lianum]|uniref:Glycosyltransferase, catalytic subunit of cellulose synthase and poly-beta-1,6-N-acetylglucosamine synthase n=1 Tax=Cyclobacterium lianum TaxID=388280 RepID=A0A1M7PF94_9BACT|nr:glycosyltransferase [Cyclobacterium lianum]SHN15680.1 Glycosyltransferase, catalytic subunit of cellulose synthase and poly-beta-1,6-N-acetylglucosamine synthase [Cyclobacterium lianum]
MVLFEIITWICCFYLLFPLISASLAVFRSEKLEKDPAHCADFACVITLYKEADIAWPLVRSLLQQDYPKFHIYLVVDGIEEVRTPAVSDKRLTVLKPEEFLHSKVASLDLALRSMQEHHSHVVVFDPDNLVPAHFLREINRYHAIGYVAVQGKRIAKNIKGTYAALDALGEYYYDFAVRSVPFMLGSSSTIAGSGMSLEKTIYRQNIAGEMQVLQDRGLVVAEDKSLQLELVSSGHRIAYSAAAIVFDEKVTAAHQVGRQRGRWLNSYFGQLPASLGLFLRGLFRLDWNKVYFALMVSMPPMIMLTAAAMLLAIASLWIKWPYFFLITGCVCLFGLGFLSILTFNKTPGRVFKSIPKIPLFVWGQLSGILHIRKASKDFMATTHSEVMEIGPLWEKRKREFQYLEHRWK